MLQMYSSLIFALHLPPNYITQKTVKTHLFENQHIIII